MDSSLATSPVSWEDHSTLWTWTQGEHVTLIGPTGQGKTTLARAILPRRTYSLVLASKPRDSLLHQFPDHTVVRSWAPHERKVILWPKMTEPEDVITQRDVFATALRDVYRQGGWSVYLDEARYVTDFLGLAKLVELLWLQGRSLGVSVVASTQRPRHLPLEAYSQASHVYMWRTRDLQDLKRLADMAGGPPVSEIRAAVSALPQYGVLYLSSTGEMRSTKVDPQA